MRGKRKRRTLPTSLWVAVVGVALMCVAYNAFLVPARVAAGGVTGIATILYYLFNLPVGTMVLVINIPLFIWAWVAQGFRILWRTALLTLLLSAGIDNLPIPALTGDPLLASVYGGAILGVGLGLALRCGTSTGGSDLVASLLHKRHPHLSLGAFLFAADCLVVLASGIAFDFELALYALVALMISSKMVDFLQEGIRSARTFLIATAQHDVIVRRISEELERGATIIPAQGAYTGQARTLLFVVVGRLEVRDLRQIVEESDPSAFMTIMNAVEVTGEGFGAWNNKPPAAKGLRGKG